LKNRFFGGIESCRKSKKKKGAVLFNTAPFFLFDLRRFEPAKKPILQVISVYRLSLRPELKKRPVLF
jgi:hypothetical protein